MTPQRDVNSIYHLQKVKLGEGSFGVVWRAVHRETGSPAAVKQLTKAKMPSRNVSRDDVEREIQVWSMLRHENIVQLYDTFEDAGNVFMALEYCDGGDFGDKLVERGTKTTEVEFVHWTQQILAAVAYMHSRRVCHRDIKPENFLLTEDQTLKCADMGLAVRCPGNGRLLTTKCGTPSFMAPELHLMPQQSLGYDMKVDIWAAGVCMFLIMFHGKHPFFNTVTRRLDLRALLSGGAGVWPKTSRLGSLNLGGWSASTPRISGVAPEARGLCQRMLEVDPLCRPTAKEALNWPWLRRNITSDAEVVKGKSSPHGERMERMSPRTPREMEHRRSAPVLLGRASVNNPISKDREVKRGARKLLTAPAAGWSPRL